MGKYKRHTLYARVYGKDDDNYSITDAILNDKNRGQEFMSGNMIEDLDKQTSLYTSIDDLLESYPLEVYGEDIKMFDPIIIVDKDYDDRSKSYPIYDIVFEKEAKDLLEQDNIRMLVSDYLKNNPYDIEKFRGIKEIFENVKNKYPYKTFEQLVDVTIFIYFEGNNYKRYRESYFKLKKLNRSRVK